ncbi:hypothetical protein CMQ_8062 [Grosmannia clavigera kw1407]|uniref:Uncharacterized protein n=1 Tax=Grosmannia clavigera (strain kw1407 / UAMH 11150) TaxID=655863 RepID=F0XKJ7_GROCL|nr:uncharacterized protein CMQ_8062 [Grosmannia clavigera kw1407]EFX01596.1 hypothetical protein CMQ_8062 [Grosmannia clavigera kw1407]
MRHGGRAAGSRGCSDGGERKRRNNSSSWCWCSLACTASEEAVEAEGETKDVGSARRLLLKSC